MSKNSSFRETAIIYTVSYFVAVMAAQLAARDKETELTLWSLVFLFFVPMSTLTTYYFLEASVGEFDQEDVSAKSLSSFKRAALPISFSPVVLLIVYICDISSHFHWLKYLPLLFIIGIFIYSAYTINVLTLKKSSVGFTSLFRDHGFACLFFFFSAFLSVTIYFGFAFAFEDRSLRPGLEGIKITYSKVVEAAAEDEAPCNETIAARLLYSEGDVWPQRLEGQGGDYQRMNEDQVRGIIQWVEGMRTKPCRFVFTVLGHASTKELGIETRALYRDNYLISQVRAQHAVRVIVDRLVGRDFPIWRIDWQSIGGSAERRFLEVQTSLERPRAEVRTRSVEIIGKAVRDLGHVGYLQHRGKERISDKSPKLLDYFYFSVLTITTTGYGDMVPVSQYAKFLVIFANVLEVFYGVIFFGILVSTLVSR